MAATHVALLRGINIGKAKRVAMAELRALAQELGYTEVRTLLNSGNVVLCAPGAPAREVALALEEALVERTGVRARVLVLGADELRAVMAANPLAGLAHDHSRLFVSVFPSSEDSARVEPLLARDWSPERLALGPRAVYAWCPDGFSDSPLVEALTRALGGAVTSRNWNTMVKLAGMI